MRVYAQLGMELGLRRPSPCLPHVPPPLRFKVNIH